MENNANEMTINGVRYVRYDYDRQHVVYTFGGGDGEGDGWGDDSGVGWGDDSVVGWGEDW